MRALLPTGPERTAAEVVDGLGLQRGGQPGRPRVVAIMIASVDGRATVDGGSTKLGHPEDRALLRGLRAAADCLLAGTQTLAAEGYANLLDADQRAAREADGRAPHPLVATLTRSGDVPWDTPVFREPGVAKQVYAGRSVDVPPGATDVRVDVVGGAAAALGHLAEERGVRSVACEGGPGLLRALLADGLVDDLLLTVAPLLVAGDGPAATAGAPLPGPPRLALRDVWRADDHLFLHYAR